ncbi:MAG: hypothetical protein KF812_12530 [Fimbriimonadaceae bacterium]|nr:hypothetical protein [Fimbriimonadaceae bacterium]
MSTVRINGGHGEGGGALLRTAIVTGALTQRTVSIHSVRGAMRKPGLNAEDLALITAVATMTKANVYGDHPGSNEVNFEPKVAPRRLTDTIDVAQFESGTVSGGALVIASSLLPLLARATGYSEVSIAGETHGSNMLSFESFERSLLPALRAFGLYGFPALEKAGFGYGVHGKVRLETEPSGLSGVNLRKRGELSRGGAIVCYGDLREEIAERASATLSPLMERRGLNPEIEIVEVPTREPGLHITVWSEFDSAFGSGSASGRRGTKIEVVAEEAVSSFDEWFQTDTTLDSYLADQVLLTAALADGPTFFSVPRVTRRLLTMAWVIKQFMPIPITIRGAEGSPGTISVEK